MSNAYKWFGLLAVLGIAYMFGDKENVSKNPKRVAKKPRKRRYKLHIQTIRFAKKLFTKREARKWAKRDGRKVPKRIEAMKNFWSLRQISPKRFVKKSFRTITLANGVTAIIGKPRPKTRTRRARPKKRR